MTSSGHLERTADVGDPYVPVGGSDRVVIASVSGAERCSLHHGRERQSSRREKQLMGGAPRPEAETVARFVSRDRHQAGSRSAALHNGHSVVALSPAVVAAVRRMGRAMGQVGKAEVVRRGLILLDFLLSLGDDEELVVRDCRTGEVDQLRFSWDRRPSPPPA